MLAQGLNQNTLHYLNDYLEKTLGVSQILNQLPGPKPETDLGFFFEDYNQYSTAENDLAVKMIDAMKIDSKKYIISDIIQKNKFKNRIQIFFVHHPITDFETYSARVLLQNPGLKKKTWEFLKKQIESFRQL
jgi:hypothetical protein